ncbi:PspC domain-containing protein [Thalassotalea ponticola]|uniref:PspC domain-containing protein n=1 Tax=Thalassotalea ponticola TaxID=1523392 RepID=UPI0025B5D285|nr:PspC domain-containing protein [Thalassotalea ponticola]MDN3653773.1 PspC domain-containing protein [Thalassotalea ponticola]
MTHFKKHVTLSKDMLNKKICGVCAGIARYFDLPVFGVRAATVVVGLMMPSTAVIAYLVAALVMPNRY